MADYSRLKNEAFVEQLYRTLLGRAPDPEGFAHMVGRLRKGDDRLALVQAFAESDEFRARRPAEATFAPPGHFYSPFASKEAIEAHRGFDWNPPAIPGVDLNEQGQMRLLEALAPHYAAMPFADAPSERARYGFNNPSFGSADAILLFTIIQHLKPRRIIEVGSGHSSCAILDAVEHLPKGTTDVRFIEPYPELLQRLVRPGDLPPGRLRASGLQEVPLDEFRALERGDILFIDSSHVAKLASDVSYLFFHILPALRAGVWVHIHDIFYPFEYPLQWYLEGRCWNEAYVLRTFLQYNAAWRIELFSTFMLHRHAPWFQAHMPLALANTGGHIWISRVTD